MRSLKYIIRYQSLFESFGLTSCCGGNNWGVELRRAERVWGEFSGPVFGAVAPRVHPGYVGFKGGAFPRVVHFRVEPSMRE